MSKAKQLTDLIEEDNASGSSPRRSSRIATRRLSSCDEIPSSPAKTRSRRPSLTLEINGTPAKLTRSKRSSLSIESDSKDTDSLSPASKKSSSPADITSGGPAKRTRRRGSLTNSTQDETEVSTPIPNRVVTRRLSGRHSMSKSPTGENASPPTGNLDLPKVTTPNKRRGRRPSVTEKVIPLEAIEETELNKGEDESNSSKTIIVDLTDVIENVDKKVSNAPKSENLETILESSILDSQEGADIEKNLSLKLERHVNDTGINKSFKMDKSIEILNDVSLNKSSKDKALNRSENACTKNNESGKNKSLEISYGSPSRTGNKTAEIKNFDDNNECGKIQSEISHLSPSKINVSSRRNKTEEIINLDEEENKNKSWNKSKSKNKTSELDSSNIENVESELLTVLNLSHNMSGTSKLQEKSGKLQSSLDKGSFCEAYVNLSVKNESVNKSNESDKENKHKSPSIVITENSGINKGSEDLFSEPMEIDDYPPDTSDENIAKCNTPNNSLIGQSKEDILNSSSIEKEEIGILSPIISSVGKRNKAQNQLLNANISVLFDVACANSTPKRVTLNQKENGQKDVDSNTSSKKLSAEEDNAKDKSKRNSRELSFDINESKRITRKSLSLNKSEQKSEENLNLSANLNESKSKLNEKSNRKSQDLNLSDVNEKSTRILRSSTGNSSASIDENVAEDFICLEESVNKSASKEKSKRKSQSRLDEIDADQGDEKSKRQSKNVSVVSDKSPFKDSSKRKSKNLSQSIDKDESFEKSTSENKSNRKSRNLSQSKDQDESIEKSASEESTKKKFKDLLQSSNTEENVKTPQRKSKCLSNLIDVDESDDDFKSTQKSKSIHESDTESNVTSKSVNLSKNVDESISRKTLNAKLAASNKSIDKSKSDAELEATINKFVESYNLLDDDDEEEHNSLLDDQASEGEEDTPSENSCDIPIDGESLGSSDSEKTLDESYEQDSFIVSDEETELLSGNEFDLDQSTSSKRLKAVQDDDDDSEDMESDSKTKKKKQKSENIVPSISDPIPSPEKKKASQKIIEEDSDLENMSTKPYCGLDPPSVASSRESLSEADKIEVSSKNTENLIDQSKMTPIKSPRNSPNTSFTGNLNITVVEDTNNTTRRSRTTSLLVQEQFENYKVENVCDHISKVVNMVYSDSKKDDVDVSLSVSLEFTEKRKSKTTDTPNTTLDLPVENFSSEVISVPSSDEDNSKKVSKEVIHMDSSTDSDMSDDVDEDVTTKYYESRLISKEEDMMRQSRSGVPKQGKPDPKFSSSSEESAAEEQQNENLLQESDIKNLKKQDKVLSEPNTNILPVTEPAKIQQGKTHKKAGPGRTKIIQTKLIPVLKESVEVVPSKNVTEPAKIQQGKTIKKERPGRTKILQRKLIPVLKESVEVVPSKKMKFNEETTTIRKKKQKLQPSTNLTDGDSFEVNYFPSKILNTIVHNEKSNKKPRVVPSKSSNQTSWDCKPSSPLKPSGSIFTQKKIKSEPKIDKRDFKTNMLNDKSRNRRMDMETLLMMKNKMKQQVRR